MASSADPGDDGEPRMTAHARQRPAPEPAVITLRYLAAAAILVGGLVHLELYFRGGYRDVPNANLGRSFILNGVGSIAVAAALLVRRDVVARLAGIAVTVGTLIAFTLSRRTDRGVFGFTERGLSPAPQAVLALVSELLALVVLAISFIPALSWRQGTAGPPRLAWAAAAGVVVIGAVATLVWANSG